MGAICWLVLTIRCHITHRDAWADETKEAAAAATTLNNLQYKTGRGTEVCCWGRSRKERIGFSSCGLDSVLRGRCLCVCLTYLACMHPSMQGGHLGGGGEGMKSWAKRNAESWRAPARSTAAACRRRPARPPYHHHRLLQLQLLHLLANSTPASMFLLSRPFIFPSPACS